MLGKCILHLLPFGDLGTKHEHLEWEGIGILVGLVTLFACTSWAAGNVKISLDEEAREGRGPEKYFACCMATDLQEAVNKYALIDFFP